MDKRYCYTCGAEVERMFVTYAYNEETGEPQISEHRKCPTVRWYTLGHPTTESESYAMQA